MDRKTKRHFMFSGHMGRLENKLPTSIPCCEHGTYCSKLKLLDKSHCSLDYAKECGQVKRFYDRYKEAGNQMGVGS